MSVDLKLCEHESVEWILKQIPKFSKKSFLKKFDVKVTSIDVNADLFLLGTNNGNIYIINRSNISIENLLLKKDVIISTVKLIHTVDLSIGIGLNDGAVFILTIPFNDSFNYSDMNQFIVPTEHKTSISAMCWSKNSEKLYTGDVHGFIFCTEVNHITKTVQAYQVYQCFSAVNQLAYDHKCLIISSIAETFMWNFNLNRKISIGNKNRTEKNVFGVSIVNKLCKSEEMEVISVRPNGKIWISDINGIVKKSIILKPDLVFAPDKLMSLLPCVTSQSKISFFDDVVSGKTKFYLGQIIPINENEMLFWSENSIVIFDICSGNIISSSFNLGKIQNISICNILKIPIDDLNKVSPSNYQGPDKQIYEIWILRQPICENDSKLVRLSFIPLITTRLQIDPFYFSSQAKISANNDIHQIINVKESNIVKIADENQKPQDKAEIVSENEKTQKNWFSKIGVTKQRIDIVETLNDMRSNMLEFSNKTKEVFKQGQAILNDESELVVEQANELTEEGVVINFENSGLSTENSSINLDPSLEVQSNIIINPSCNRLRKENRKIEVVAFEENGDVTVGRNIKENSETNQDNKNCLTSFEQQFASSITKSKDSESSEDDSYERSELYLDIIGRPMSTIPYEENNFYPSNLKEHDVRNENQLNIKECTESNLFPDIDEGNKNYNYDSCNVSSPISTADILDIVSTQSTESYDALMSSNSFTDKDKFINEFNNDSNLFLENDSIINEVDHNLSITIKNTVEKVADDHELQHEEKCSPILNEDVQIPLKDIEQKQIVLSNSILLQSNKWISHRGPVLPTNVKLCSMTVNRCMIWMTDTKSVLHVGFKNTEKDEGLEQNTNSTVKMLWLQDINLRTDKLASSPNGFILWREKCGEVSVYTGVSKILTPKVVKDKVLLKQYWEVTMQEIKEIDIDEEMAVIVTRKGQLKVINGISSRTPYKQSKSVNITGHVTLATTFNGLIWCVTELDIANTSKLSQHVFACQTKDEDGNFNSTYWRTVPLLTDLVKEEEQNFGGLGGSELIKSIHLGTGNLAWILTIDNMCFYCQNVSSENPIGDGIWFQITLQFLYQTLSNFEENTMSYGIQNKVEKMFGYSEIDTKYKKANSLNCTSSILLSAKSVPKKAKGNGLLWITSTERNSPCILFESDRNILGHHWTDCFSVLKNQKNRLPGLPALISWAAVEFSHKNTLWLLHRSGELFCYHEEKNIKTVAIPPLYGRVIKISARNTMLCILTTRSKIFIRIGITDSNPYGSDWREIKRGWSKNEKIKSISCSDNEIWLIFENRAFYNENIKALLFDVSKKLPWNELIFKNKDSNAKKVSAIQIFKSTNRNCIWVITETFGYVYFSAWVPFVNSFSWTYIPGPSAESIHVSNENVWIVEQATGNIFVRCGIDWINQPMGDYWINVPVITKPVISMTVSLNNQVFIIDSSNRLLKHSWTIIEGNVSPSESESTSAEFVKPDDYDWELLS